ncbi:MAG: AmmeMemoRadiSam system protein B [Acidobacteria bacterium]|nr:AmmeMemoRadiSam system protein B [Acidobacteriota bacterium]
MLRKPAVAGRFYPADKETLQSDIVRYVGAVQADLSARGVIVPHAGYMYSGHVAGAVYARLRIPARVIVLCPNHTGLGASLSVMSSGSWEIPLGRVPIDTALAKSLARHCHLLTEDASAHQSEHSLEVQLPFLFHLRSDFQFVPIAVGTSGYAALESLGKGIEAAIQELSDEVLVIASSDMNHYESDEATRVKDQKAIDRILALEPKGLYDTVKSESISMCGYGPAIAMMHGVQPLTSRKAELIKYATSGDVSGNRREVVGYAGIVVH